MQTLVLLISLGSSASLLVGATTPTYYVSASKGADTNDGLSPARPWRTLQKVNSAALAPGDRVLLSRGDTWRENLTLTSSGAEGHPIVIASYGDGGLPRILGSDSLSGLEKWAMYTSQVWVTNNINWEPKALFIDGVGRRRRSSVPELSAEGDWTYDASTRRVFCRSVTNPGAGSMEAVRRNAVGFNWVHFVTLQEIEIRFADFGVAMYGSSFWVLQDLIIQDIARDAVHGNNASRRVTVRRCTIRDWNWNGYKAEFGSGISYQAYGVHLQSTSGSAPSDNWIIEDNSFSVVRMESGEDTTAIVVDERGHAASISGNTIAGNPRTTMGGIMVWRPAGASGITISRNKIQNVGTIAINVSEFDVHGMNASTVVEKNTVHNSCAADHIDEEAMRIWTRNASPVFVSNNIVCHTAVGRYRHQGVRVRQSNAEIIFNTIFSADDGISVESASTASLLNNISFGNRSLAASVDSGSKVRAQGNILNGTAAGIDAVANFFSAPGLTNPATDDFRPTSGSPAIDAAFPTASTVPTDLAGTMRPTGRASDIGAFEYKQSSVIANGDWETGDLSGWETYGPVAVVAEAADSGRYGLKVLAGGRVDQRFPTQAGRVYDVFARMRLIRQVASPTWGGLRLRVLDPSWRPLSSSAMYNAANLTATDWVTIQFSFTAVSDQSRVVFETFSDGLFESTLDNIMVVPR